MTNGPHDAWFALYPYGGGGVGAYRALSPYLGGSHLHLPVLPGRDARQRETPLTTFEALSDDLWTQLRPDLDAHGAHRLVLFGYSLGAMLAYDMARRIEAGGDSPRALVVGGAAAPGRWVRRGIADLEEEAFVSRLRNLGIAPAELLDEPWIRHTFMPVWRADAAVAESILLDRVPLRCPVSSIAGNRDPLASSDDLAAWTATGGPGSTSAVVGGDHGTLIRNPVLMARTLWQAAA